VSPQKGETDGCGTGIVLIVIVLLMSSLAPSVIHAASLQEGETPNRLAVLGIGMFVAGVVITLLCEQWVDNRRSGQ